MPAALQLARILGLAGAVAAYRLPSSSRSPPASARAASPSMVTEEEAKAAWLARQPLAGFASMPQIPIVDATAPDIAADIGQPAKLSEEEAKERWLARREAPAWGDAAAAPESEEEAKERWLARLNADAPTWGKAAAVVSNVAAEAAAFSKLTSSCDAGEARACATLSKEEEAKKAWLAQLDAPTWGKAAEAVNKVVQEFAAPPALSEEEAKQRWLERCDAPTWGKAAAVVANVAAEAAEIAELTDRCELGETEACVSLSKEEAAKGVWLAYLNAPTWAKAHAKSVAAAAKDASSWGDHHVY